MFGAISFRKFMEQVEERLKSYSPDTLQEIITAWAKKISSGQAGKIFRG